MAEPVELRVGEEVHRGFVQGQVTQAFGGARLITTSWRLEYSPRAAHDEETLLIEAGDPVVLRVGDEVLVDGYVDTEHTRYDAERVQRSVSGRSRLGDLVDCSAVVPSRRLREQSFSAILRRLTDGYDVTVRERVLSDEPIATFAIQEGESIADALGRAARVRALVLVDLAGDLVVETVGSRQTGTRIERGRNVLSGERTLSWTQRFSEYRFRGQTRADDDVNGLHAAQIGQTITDRGVSRLRRLVVHAHGHRRGDLGRRAIMERNARAGRSETFTYELAGWTTDEGLLWRPGVRVQVLDDWLGVDAELMVVRVEHRFALDQYRTRMQLTRRAAFTELEYPERPRGGRWR